MKDSANVLPTVRRARRHVRREEVVPASNAVEEALATGAATLQPDTNYRKLESGNPSLDICAQ